VKKEAAAAGLTVGAAIAYAAASGWAGFKADWYRNAENQNQHNETKNSSRNHSGPSGPNRGTNISQQGIAAMLGGGSLFQMGLPNQRPQLDAAGTP
jgi:hypothetical protein